MTGQPRRPADGEQRLAKTLRCASLGLLLVTAWSVTALPA